jgi:hypothetical protein
MPDEEDEIQMARGQIAKTFKVLELLKRRKERDDPAYQSAAADAREIIAAMEKLRKIIYRSHEMLEHKELLYDYERVIDQARELI